jgi:hypothetical protein
LKIPGLLFQQSADVHAGRPGAADGDDVLNLGEAEPETASAPDKSEHAEHGFGVKTIPGRGAARSGQDAPSLVNQERLAAEAALGCYLADPQPFCHALRLRPTLRGRVKREI